MCENDNMMITKEYRNLYEITITHYVEIRAMYFHTSNIFDKEIFFWYYDLDDNDEKPYRTFETYIMVLYLFCF